MHIKKFLPNKRALIIIFLLLSLWFVLNNTLFKTLTFNPLTEREQIIQLESTKTLTPLNEFTSDGCSGNVSLLWTQAVNTLSDVFPKIDKNYADVQNIPFESACMDHDKLYYLGVGGYKGRLIADNMLREAILTYALENTEEIKARIGYETDETAIFLYESIAEFVYRGVRIGGAPCTGEPYAWGYGYSDGNCEIK